VSAATTCSLGFDEFILSPNRGAGVVCAPIDGAHGFFRTTLLSRVELEGSYYLMRAAEIQEYAVVWEASSASARELIDGLI